MVRLQRACWVTMFECSTTWHVDVIFQHVQKTTDIELMSYFVEIQLYWVWIRGSVILAAWCCTQQLFHNLWRYYSWFSSKKQARIDAQIWLHVFFSSPSCWSMYPINSHYISLNPWDLVAYPLEFLFPLSFPKTSFDSEIRGDSSRLETRGRKSGPRLRAVPGTCTAAFGSGGGWRADSAAPAPSGRVGIPGIPGDDLGMFQMMSAWWWCVNVSMFDDFLVSLFFRPKMVIAGSTGNTATYHS